MTAASSPTTCEVCGDDQWPGLLDDVPLCVSCLRGAVAMALKVAEDAADIAMRPIPDAPVVPTVPTEQDDGLFLARDGRGEMTVWMAGEPPIALLVALDIPIHGRDALWSHICRDLSDRTGEDDDS